MGRNYILYNPFAGNKTGEESALKIRDFYKDEDCEVISVKSLKDYNDFIGGLNTEANKVTTNDMSEFNEIAGKILGFLRNASYIIGVIVLVVLGIKYMMGSLEEKAEYKKSLIPLVVGVIIVMGATTIATFLFNTFD